MTGTEVWLPLLIGGGAFVLLTVTFMAGIVAGRYLSTSPRTWAMRVYQHDETMERQIESALRDLTQNAIAKSQEEVFARDYPQNGGA